MVLVRVHTPDFSHSAQFNLPQRLEALLDAVAAEFGLQRGTLFLRSKYQAGPPNSCTWVVLTSQAELDAVRVEALESSQHTVDIEVRARHAAGGAPARAVSSRKTPSPRGPPIRARAHR